MSVMDTMSGRDTIEMRDIEKKDMKEDIQILIESGGMATADNIQGRDPQAMIPTGDGTTQDRDQIALTGTITAIETVIMRVDGKGETRTIGMKGAVLAIVVTNIDVDVLDWTYGDGADWFFLEAIIVPF